MSYLENEVICNPFDKEAVPQIVEAVEKVNAKLAEEHFATPLSAFIPAVAYNDRIPMIF